MRQGYAFEMSILFGIDNFYACHSYTKLGRYKNAQTSFYPFSPFVSTCRFKRAFAFTRDSRRLSLKTCCAFA
jgi:hypothetical protein